MLNNFRRERDTGVASLTPPQRSLAIITILPNSLPELPIPVLRSKEHRKLYGWAKLCRLVVFGGNRQARLNTTHIVPSSTRRKLSTAVSMQPTISHHDAPPKLERHIGVTSFKVTVNGQEAVNGRIVSSCRPSSSAIVAGSPWTGNANLGADG
jgi:hypothetical protein